MPENVKKILLSIKTLIITNKYSLLLLCIFALVLKLTRDCSLILSFIILLALYLILGVVVEVVLEKYFPQFADKKPDAGSHGRSPETRNTESAARPKPTERREDVRRPVKRAETAVRTEREVRISESEQGIPIKRASVNRTVRTELPDRRSGIADHTAIRQRAERSPAQGTKAGEAEPKVTSSYIKSAGSIPREMERKLVRTAADFNTIRRNSERLSSGEEKVRRVYGSSSNPFVENPEELYTNKKNIEKSENTDEIINKNDNASEPEIQTRNSGIKKRAEADVSYQDEYVSTSVEEMDRISENIVREVTERVSAPRKIRKSHVVIPNEHISTEEPVRYRKQNLYSEGAERRNTNPANVRRETEQTEQPLQQEAQPQRRREIENDKVSSDIDKINKLFNRGNTPDESDDAQNKTGLWSRFKKKR